MPEEFADDLGRPEFTRASDLYDVETGEHTHWDWAKMQPVTESQSEVERAVSGVLDDGKVPGGD